MNNQRVLWEHRNVRTKTIPTYTYYKDENSQLCMKQSYKILIVIDHMDYNNEEQVIKEVGEDLWEVLNANLYDYNDGDGYYLKDKREWLERELSPNFVKQQAKEQLQKQQKKDERNEQISLESENAPDELKIVIRSVVGDNIKIVKQYLEGNDKSINSLVGQVMKQFRYDAAVIKQLLEKEVMSHVRPSYPKG